MSDTWNCCRTCLNTQRLHPIFALTEHSEKYSDVILLTTGVKVEKDDTLPQEICSECIIFINESSRFRKRCKDAQISLNDYKLHSVKLEHVHNQNEGCDKSNAIDISELLPPNDDYKDEIDNVDTFNCEDKNETSEKEYVTKIEEVIEEPAVVTINNKRTRRNNGKVKTRKAAEKKEESKGKGSKSESVKQEIECEFCHKILTSKLSLRNHYKIHTGFDVVCEHCGKKFITRRLLLMHCRAKHGYEKTDKCSFCDYKASNAEQVKIHERLHTGEKPFVCGECGAGFHRRSSYLQHIAIHLPEKTVQCSQCPARFKSATLMRIHAHRHRPPRHAYRCALCGGQFARRRNVARHLQRVHATQVAREHIQRHELP